MGEHLSREADLIAYARQAAKCIYIAVEKTVADDVSATINELIARTLAAEAHCDALRQALEPFAECAKVFGPDWSDGDEIAGNGHLLFALRVGHFRAAALAGKEQGNG